MASFEVVIDAVDNASPQLKKLSDGLVEAAKRAGEFAKDITNSTSQADKAISELPAKAKTATATIESAQTAVKQLLAQFAAIGSAAGITAFFRSAAMSALEEETALKRLEFAVNSIGGSFEREKDKILAFAREQQSLTRFSDEQTYQVLGRLVRITGDLEQAMLATKLAFGMAAASGSDLNHVIELLGPVLNGDATRLRALRNEFGSFIGDANSAQEVLASLSEHFLNTASKETTFGVELSKLKNKLNDFKEVIGAGIIPGFKYFLEAVVKGAQFLEILGTALAELSAKALVYVQSLGAQALAIVKLNFDRIAEIKQNTAAQIEAIDKESLEKYAELHKRYTREVESSVIKQNELKARVTRKSIEDAQKEADEKRKAIQDAHYKLMSLEAERLETEGRNLESRLIIIELEKEARIRQFEELRSKGLITENELLNAKLNASEIALSAIRKAREEADLEFKMLQETSQAVSNAFASNFSNAIADMMLNGKKFEDAWKEVMNSVLRTAIETFTKIAIERAMAESAAAGVSSLAPIGILAGFTSIMAPIGKGLGKIFGFQEGGIVKEPVLATVGEKGPEAVIPLNKLNDFNKEIKLNLNQNITLNVTGLNDETAKLIMKKISEITRAGTMEGVELVKSITSKQARLSRESL